MNLVIIQKIRWLQTAEGHRPCFKTDNVECPFVKTCCWTELCADEDVKVKPLLKFEVIE